MKRFITIFVLIMTVLPCRAAGAGKMTGETTASAPADSVCVDESPAPRAELFRPSKLIVPGVLFTAGVVGVNRDW